MLVVALPLLFLVVGTLAHFLLYAGEAAVPSLQGFVEAACVFDCAWYERLAREGYDAAPFAHPAGDAANWAFFPLYPLLMAAFARVTGASPVIAGMVLSGVFSLVAAWLAWPLLEGAKRAYALFCAYLFFSPFSAFFLAPYTESLFVALTLGGFLALKDDRFIAAGVLGALLSATRATGIFFAVAILVAAFWRHRAAGGRLRAFPAALAERDDVVFALALAPMGLVAFMVFLHFHIGDALAFAHVQRAWGREAGNPLQFLLRGLLPGEANWFSPVQVWALSALAGLALTVLLVRRGRWGEAAFSGLSILLPLLTGLLSMTRLVAGLAPLALFAARLFSRSTWIFVATLAAMLLGGLLAYPAWLDASRYLM